MHGLSQTRCQQWARNNTSWVKNLPAWQNYSESGASYSKSEMWPWVMVLSLGQQCHHAVCAYFSLWFRPSCKRGKRKQAFWVCIDMLLGAAWHVWSLSSSATDQEEEMHKKYISNSAYFGTEQNLHVVILSDFSAFSCFVKSTLVLLYGHHNNWMTLGASCIFNFLLLIPFI